MTTTIMLSNHNRHVEWVVCNENAEQAKSSQLFLSGEMTAVDRVDEEAVN